MIEFNQQRIGVVGLGYVGLPLLIHLHQSKSVVFGFDVDKKLIEDLNAGITTNPNIDIKALHQIIKDPQSGISADANELKSCDVVVVCVPTPLNESKGIDLTYLKSAVSIIDENASSNVLVINESTSYPGTLREIFASKLQQSPTRVIHLATAPERIDPGNSIPIQEIPRVVGGIDEESKRRAKVFYDKYFSKVMLVSSPEIAEMSKLLENTFRQVNISLINEVNDLCRRAGIDAREVIQAASTKPYGFMRFDPSAGIGGHCIPVDPEYLQFFAGKFGNSLKIISAASSVNEDMGKLIFERLKNHTKNKVLSSGVILGIAYKANIPDSREAPAKILISYLRSRGIKISWHDPLIKTWEEEISSKLIENTWDFGIVVTAHDDLDINTAKKSCKVIFDCTGRYSFDPEIVQI